MVFIFETIVGATYINIFVWGACGEWWGQDHTPHRRCWFSQPWPLCTSLSLFPSHCIIWDYPLIIITLYLLFAFLKWHAKEPRGQVSENPSLFYYNRVILKKRLIWVFFSWIPVNTSDKPGCLFLIGHVATFTSGFLSGEGPCRKSLSFLRVHA